MTRLLTLIPFVALAACATTHEQVAQAECKVAPITITSITGRAKPTTSLERREAEHALATSDLRFRLLRERGMMNNNVEEALHDCNVATR